MALKGHTIIELKNAETGEVKKVESDNIITNFFSDLVNETLPYSTMAPGNVLNYYRNFKAIDRFFNGIICFDNTIEEDPNNYFLPGGVYPTAQGVRDKSYSGANPLIGTYNTSESGDIENGIRMVWDFSTSQGNGTIASASLVNNYVALAGLGSPTIDSGNQSTSYCMFFGPYSSGLSTDLKLFYGTNVSYREPILGYSDEYVYKLGGEQFLRPYGGVANSLMVSKQLNMYRYQMSKLNSVSIFEYNNFYIGESSSNGGYDLEPISLPLPTEIIDSISNYDTIFRSGAAVRACISTYYRENHLYIIFLFSPSMTIINNSTYGIPNNEQFPVWDIDLTTLESKVIWVTNTTGSNLGFSAGGTESSTSSGNYCTRYCRSHPFLLTEKYVFIQSYPAWFRISLEDNTNVTLVKNRDGSDFNTGYNRNYSLYCPSSVIELNGKLYFSVSKSSSPVDDNLSFCLDIEDGIVDRISSVNNLHGSRYSYATGPYKKIPGKRNMFYYSDQDRNCVGIIKFPYCLSTINNLPTPVTKTSAETMKITYILQETS